MYEELIQRLREVDVNEYDDEWEFAYDCQRAMHEAADAIEELNAYAQQFEKLRKEGWYLQKVKMMTYGQATMTMPLPDPPKEET